MKIVRWLVILKSTLGKIARYPFSFICRHSFFSRVRETTKTENPIQAGDLVRYFWNGRRGPYWLVHPTSVVRGSWRNIHIGVDVSPGASPGCYIQGLGTIRIGDYTNIGPQVGIISANHDLHDARVHLLEHVEIGQYCWIGMGSVILPGVELGDFTIVAAGSIVTKPFSEGYVVIGGNPAQIIRKLNPADCVRYEHKHKYHGFLSQREFEVMEKIELNPFFQKERSLINRGELK